MATWTSSVDVLADLDMLSEFSAGCNYPKDIPIVWYSSYGRGIRIEEESSRPPSPLFNMVGEADFQLPPSSELGAGRGERILPISRDEQDASLHQQLRMAVGPGYSNDLIEKFMRSESACVHSDKVDQFDDTEEGISFHEATIDHSVEAGKSSYETAPDDSATDTKRTSSSATKPEQVESSDSDAPTKHMMPRKSQWRNRNALLNSLANYRTESVMEFDSKNEIKALSPVQYHNSICDHSLTHPYPFSGHFKKKTENSRLTQVGGMNLDDSTKCIRKSDGTFEFRAEDFPPL